MADTTQGITLDVDPATPQGQGQPEPATPNAGFDPSLYVPDDPNAPSQSGVVQGQQTPTQPVFDPAKHFQSIADQRLAENLRLQQELQRLQSQIPQNSQATQTNPFDPNKDWASWIRFETQAGARQAAQESAQAVRAEFQGMFRQATEAQWAQAHPGTDINAVKAFQQLRGIANLDDAYTLMTLPNQLAQVQSQTAQQTINQFRQPVAGATAIRGSQNATLGGPQTPQQYSYAKMAQAYANNPNVEASWPAELKDAFWKETNARSAG